MLPRSTATIGRPGRPVTVQKRESPLPTIAEVPPNVPMRPVPVPVAHAEAERGPATTQGPIDNLDIGLLAEQLFEPLARMLRAEAEREQAAAPDPMDGLNFDELARRLFEPLARMLRAEIRNDRERAGRSHERRY
jgi:hypothetical protein